MKPYMLRYALIMLSLGCASPGLEQSASPGAEPQPKPVVTEGLEGHWILKTPKDQDSQAQPTGYGSVLFDPSKNRVDGFDGCNSFQASYTEDAHGKLTFSTFARSRRLCSYTTYGPSTRALGKATTYRRQDDALTLFDAQGKVLMVLSRYRPKQPTKP